MSAKYYTTTHTHPFSWDAVAGAVFLRYPNPFATHVLTEDTLHREITAGGRLYTRRFLTKTNKPPKWGERFIGNLKRVVPLIEESVVDPIGRTVTTYTRNIGYSHFMSAVEKVEYRPDPNDPKVSTIAIKEAWIESRFYGLRSAIKNFGVERFKNNCSKATDGFNHVLSQLQERKEYLSQVPKQKWNEIRSKGGHEMAMMAVQKVATIRAASNATDSSPR